MNEKSIHKWASFCIVAISAAALVYLILDRFLFAVLPFFIAWLTAFFLRPLSRRLSRWLHIGEKAIRLLLSMLASAAIISLIVGLVWYIVNKSWQFLNSIDQNEELMSFIGSLFDGGLFSKLIYGEELAKYITEALRGVSGALLEKLGTAVSAVAMKLPGVFIFMLVTVISAAYFAYDLEGINAAVKRILPHEAAAFLIKLRAGFNRVGVRYLRSYLIIMSITFATLLFGFVIIGVDYAVLIALFVAVLDILPVFGVGTVLLPWSILSFVMGNGARGLGLAILFIFITVLREIVEPKILGKNLGLHPLLTLVLLYIGYSFFGFFGMVILPPLGALFAALFGANTSSDEGKNEKKAKGGLKEDKPA